MSIARRQLSANGDDCSAGSRTSYGYDCQLLTVASRPLAVQALYDSVEHNPAPLIAHCDLYRSDGLPGAKIFSPCPTSTRWTDVVVEDAVNPVSKAPSCSVLITFTRLYDRNISVVYLLSSTQTTPQLSLTDPGGMAR